jgi:hypothetical protein
MSDTITIRGLAVPYGEVSIDNRMRVERGAFRKMLAGSLPHIDLRWADHDDTANIIADTESDAITFFDAPFGLCFEAVVPRHNLAFLPCITRAVNPADRCSVNMLVDEDVTLDDGIQRIKVASIDHVALGLTKGNAAFAGTAVWLPAFLGSEFVPERIQDVAERWDEAWGRS